MIEMLIRGQISNTPENRMPITSNENWDFSKWVDNLDEEHLEKYEVRLFVFCPVANNEK